MASGILNIATCQFAVGDSIKRNAGQIRGFMQKASSGGADIVHFPECALSGYVGTDFASFEDFNWDLLTEETEKIMSLAGKLGLWVALGSSHRLTEPNKPHNSLYLISPDGKIADRYDKRFCTIADLRRFTPGNRFTHFVINGVKCSLLICFDVRFPELYRRLYREKVKCVFQSFYNARQKGPSIHSYIMRQTMQAHAASNGLWVSMSNPSGYFSPYPSCFIQPDGRIINQLKQNRSGIMINTVDLNRDYYDPSADYRDLAIDGIFTNGPTNLDDPRSKKTTIL
jgi:deaminated glutathione amidase